MAGQIRFHLKNKSGKRSPLTFVPKTKALSAIGMLISSFTTRDEDILNRPMVQGVKIKFSEIPVKDRPCNSSSFSGQQNQARDEEIIELLKKQVIVECNHSKGEFVSGPKKVVNGE